MNIYYNSDEMQATVEMHQFQIQSEYQAACVQQEEDLQKLRRLGEWLSLRWSKSIQWGHLTLLEIGNLRLKNNAE